ncbi:TapY2 family type IVa secretion system protein [Gallaecimonas kandeliae]|uniref:TapY2 family type IVa secretion system protein n=1 Tax=Gallaecimonas kandeliae TaxID=3029055 RepID=UPI00264A1E15|nr:TapY2 family type IVa secretion system protein [Gallaecimonas kandeliae]WKE64954.1 TapY2 family type IVa secretion system protein [Gallaecimonas kandeliae]
MRVGNSWPILALFLAAGALAKNVEYKCFLEMGGAKPAIVHFVLDQEKAKNLAYSLPYTRLHLKGEPMVTKVHECVAADSAFSSAAARKLEQQQPR